MDINDLKEGDKLRLVKPIPGACYLKLGDFFEYIGIFRSISSFVPHLAHLLNADGVPLYIYPFNLSTCFEKHEGQEPTAHVAETNLYPHTCPRCGQPAYIGINNIECSAGCA